MKHLSLRYKILLAFVSFILVYVFFSILFVNLYLKDVLKKNFIQTGRTLTSTMASHLADDVLVGDLITIDAFFEDIRKSDPDVSYIFIEKDGAVIVHTFTEGFPRNLLNVGHAGRQMDYVLVQAGGETFYDFAFPVFEGKGGTLRLGLSGKTIETSMQRTLTMLLLVTASLLLVGTIFSIYISQRLIQPLVQLTSSAMAITEGNYAEPVSVAGEDEIGELSRVFTTMTDAVKVREKELRETNEQLEMYGVRMYEYIEELNRTKDELVRAKQDAAVVETSKAFLHHMRQPLTYLIMAIEMLTDEISEAPYLNAESLSVKLRAIEDAGKRLAEMLRKFEQLKEYKTVSFSDKTRIIDIDK